MTSSELKRFLPIMLIAIFGLVLAVLVLGRNDAATGDSTAAKTPAKETADNSSAAKPKPQVTQQSTEKVTGAHDDPVPILMYHVTKTAPAGTPYPDLWVSKEDFNGQMQWLADNGYTGITMAQLFKFWDDGYKLPDKPVVISFDDGYPSHDKVARKTLAKHGWPGTLFLKLGNVGDPESGFTSKMVKNLIASGWEIGTHTINHPDLTTVSAQELEDEVAGSRKQIAEQFDVDVDFFCYPAGKYDQSVVAAVKAAGYTGAVTVIEGFATPAKPFELKRVRVNKDDGVDGFAAKMRAGS